MNPSLVGSLAWRYVRGRRSFQLRGAARAALVSSSLGVATMVVAMALMSGYSEDLQDKLIGGSAAIVAYPISGDLERVALGMTELASLPGVVSVAEVAYGQGSVSRVEQPKGYEVTLRGVDLEAVTPGRLDTRALIGGGDVPGALFGAELVRRLGVEKGEVLRLVSVDLEDLRFRYRRIRYVESFETGFAEADSGWVVLEREVVEELGGKSSLLEISLEDPSDTEATAAQVRTLLGDDFLVTDWRQYNRELFTALRLQKLALFLVLGLIVVVATFNVASTLVVLTRERRREIGVLTAMGLDRGRLQAVFVSCGVLIGGVGSLIGVSLGWSVAWLLTTFELVRFDPGVAAIYFINSVPFRVHTDDVLAILGFSLATTLVACWLPARRASRLDPTEALRYD